VAAENGTLLVSAATAPAQRATASPFALLPVGMGLAAGDRDQLTAGLENLRVVRDMPPCVSGTTFEWPEVVFDSPDAAGNAVAAALQAATCTFTVAPTEPPVTPAPPAAPSAARDIRLTPGDGFIDMAWAPPAEGADSVTDYRARCTSDGETIESTEGVSTDPGTRVDGLEQGREYRCEVATVTAAGDGDWVAHAAGAVTASDFRSADLAAGGEGVEHLSALYRPDRYTLRMEMQRKVSAGVRHWSTMLPATDVEARRAKKAS